MGVQDLSPRNTGFVGQERFPEAHIFTEGGPPGSSHRAGFWSLMSVDMVGGQGIWPLSQAGPRRGKQ